MKKPKPFLIHNSDIDTNFYEEMGNLEGRLITRGSQAFIESSVKQIDEILNENRVLNHLLIQEKQKSQSVKSSLQKTQKRITQIQCLSNVVRKQTSLVLDKTDKIKEAMLMNEFLMMENKLKNERETQSFKRKYNLCQKIREQKRLSLENKRARTTSKLERIKLESMNSTLLLKSDINKARSHTLECIQKQAKSIKMEHERQKQKIRKINNYKQAIARINYLSKVRQLQSQIEEKLGRCQILEKEDRKNRKKTSNISILSKNRQVSFFATESTI